MIIHLIHCHHSFGFFFVFCDFLFVYRTHLFCFWCWSWCGLSAHAFSYFAHILSILFHFLPRSQYVWAVSINNNIMQNFHSPNEAKSETFINCIDCCEQHFRLVWNVRATSKWARAIQMCCLIRLLWAPSVSYFYINNNIGSISFDRSRHNRPNVWSMRHFHQILDRMSTTSSCCHRGDHSIPSGTENSVEYSRSYHFCVSSTSPICALLQSIKSHTFDEHSMFSVQPKQIYFRRRKS